PFVALCSSLLWLLLFSPFVRDDAILASQDGGPRPAQESGTVADVETGELRGRGENARREFDQRDVTEMKAKVTEP
ncbi:MAG TPA: hypothetical protein P5568_04575, partial [Acidobacteriota bacterium]|nr:hypothetical protein [Acidobacteriota bacterium]